MGGFVNGLAEVMGDITGLFRRGRIIVKEIAVEGVPVVFEIARMVACDAQGAHGVIINGDKRGKFIGQGGLITRGAAIAKIPLDRAGGIDQNKADFKDAGVGPTPDKIAHKGATITIAIKERFDRMVDHMIEFFVRHDILLAQSGKNKANSAGLNTNKLRKMPGFSPTHNHRWRRAGMRRRLSFVCGWLQAVGDFAENGDVLL
jgi:hypothetical protein